MLDAAGELAPHRLSETGRREIRHLLKSVELALVALSLPTRRPFDTTDQLDDRIRRADSAFAMAYELGTKVVLVRAGAVPPEDEPARREAFTTALRDLGTRAEHRGVRLALETGSEPVEAAQGVARDDGPARAWRPASIQPQHCRPASTRSPRCASSRRGSSTLMPTTRSTLPAPLHPTRADSGFRPGALDWEEYLGALEEIGYRGFLTIWPTAGPPGRGPVQRDRRGGSSRSADTATLACPVTAVSNRSRCWRRS